MDLFTYKRLKSITVIGAIVRVANAYAFSGDPEYVDRFAPWEKWKSRVINKAFKVFVFSAALVFVGYLTDQNPSDLDIDNLILGIFPDLLGFGIGVFALVFVLPSDFVREINGLGKRRNFAAIMAPDFAYPLMVMATILALSGVLSFVEDTWETTTVSTFLLFYGLAVSIELVSSIFSIAIYIISKRSKREDYKCFKTKLKNKRKSSGQNPF